MIPSNHYGFICYINPFSEKCFVNKSGIKYKANLIVINKFLKNENLLEFCQIINKKKCFGVEIH